MIRKYLVQDYEAPPAIPRPDDLFMMGSPLDIDEKSEQPRVKVKSLVHDIDFLEKMEMFCREVEEEQNPRQFPGEEETIQTEEM